MSNVFKELKKYANQLVTSRLVVGAGGNLSMRDGDFMYISPSGYDLQETEDSDWVKVDINTGEVHSDLKPSSEVDMHLICFRNNNEIRAVLHAHPTYSVAVSSTGQDIPAMFPDFPAMVKHVAYIDYVIPTTHVLADAVGEVVNNHEAIVMRNHGVLTTGKTMKEAFFYMQLTEEAAKVYAIASSVGNPNLLTEEECDALRHLSSEKYRSQLLKEE